MHLFLFCLNCFTVQHRIFFGAFIHQVSTKMGAMSSVFAKPNL